MLNCGLYQQWTHARQMISVSTLLASRHFQDLYTLSIGSRTWQPACFHRRTSYAEIPQSAPHETWCKVNRRTITRLHPSLPGSNKFKWWNYRPLRQYAVRSSLLSTKTKEMVYQCMLIYSCVWSGLYNEDISMQRQVNVLWALALRFLGRWGNIHQRSHAPWVHTCASKRQRCRLRLDQFVKSYV